MEEISKTVIFFKFEIIKKIKILSHCIYSNWGVKSSRFEKQRARISEFRKISHFANSETVKTISFLY